MHQRCRTERSRLERKVIFSGGGGRQDEKLVTKYLTLNRVKYCRSAFTALLKIYDGVLLQKQQHSSFRKAPSKISDNKYASVLNNFRLNTIFEVTYTAQKSSFSLKIFSVNVTICCRVGHIYCRNP